GHRRGGQVGAVEVPLEEAAAGDLEVALGAGTEHLVGVVDDPDPGAGEGGPIVAPDLLRVIAGRGEGAEAGLGRAPGAADRGGEDPGGPLGERPWHRGAGYDEVYARRRPPLLARLDHAHEVGEERRRRLHEGAVPLAQRR